MRRRTALATAVVAVVGAVVVWTVAHRVFPYHSLNHDEGVYLQQASMLLEGRVTVRPPVEGALRPWFFVEDGDRLYPKYAPVPAAIFALGRALGGYRLALAGVAAGNLALVTFVVRELFGRNAGVLAAVFVLCSPLFVLNSAVFLPYAPTTLLNLAFAYAYLRSDARDDPRWAAGAGAAIGVAFFARPYTAFLFAAPFAAHALWTLREDPRGAAVRQGVTAALGLCGVGVALGYNAVLTGSAWLFPYQAFAPQDGPGFGRREILGHGVDYTVDLALRANSRIVELFFGEWFAGGLAGAALAVVGIAVVLRRGISGREAAVAGLFVSVVAGNVAFWGNFNLLGDLDRAGDGLVAVLGPYYHFDLLLPTAAFAAVGTLAAVDSVWRAADARLDPQRARVAVVVVILVVATAFGTTAAADFDERTDRNLTATETYGDAYAPFADGPPSNSVVFLPTPYGNWLNHPFQRLRTGPGYDGRAVYATDTHPFAIADAFPDRRLFRYDYRGAWSPADGSPEAAHIRPVHEVSGSRVELDASVGVPSDAESVTVGVATDDGSAYHVADPDDDLRLKLTVSEGRARLDGDVRSRAGDELAVDGREVVRLTVFVDYGPRGGFTYQLELPVEASDRHVRALTPRVDRCRGVQNCGEGTTYVPEITPEGVFVETALTPSAETELTAERNA